ncbi:MAG: response regulator transcription factor [Deltaproteobacteria bacterium]|jgi:two-component system phosphate regulon response regulator PhoB|nr:response regulator transcription factor [Deltaproteobacteria bacterium]
MLIMMIEDEAALREVVEYNLSREGFQVAAFENANDALIAVEDCPPDLILLDLMLPGLQGLQFLDILRQRDQRTPVIIISARTSEEDVIRALERGADDYLPKPFSLKLLETKVKVALRRLSGEQAPGSSRFSSGGVSLDLDSHRAVCGDSELQLTQKEFDLLALFVRKPGKVFTRNQLLNVIWGYETDVNSRTVDVHMAMLRKKLADRGRYIKTLPKIGYLWEAGPAGAK